MLRHILIIQQQETVIELLRFEPSLPSGDVTKGRVRLCQRHAPESERPRGLSL
jgi:hypothetical protein